MYCRAGMLCEGLPGGPRLKEQLALSEFIVNRDHLWGS